MLKQLGSWVTGNQGAKLALRKNVLRLHEEKNIPSSEEWWSQFWELPESAEDVFSLMTANDVKRIVANARENLETLIHKIASELFLGITTPDFPSNESPIKHVLNCVRLLTRLMPYIFESDDAAKWADEFFWAPQVVRKPKPQLEGGSRNFAVEFDEQVLPPLGERLITAVVDMLFLSGFTLPTSIATEQTKINYVIWEQGVGSSIHVPSSRDLDHNKIEVLRLLLVLSSKSMYTSGPALLTKGNRWVHYLATKTERKIVLAFLCSLLNTAVKYNPSGFGIPYNHMVLNDPKELLVSYCLQTLLVLLDYQPPATLGPTPSIPSTPMETTPFVIDDNDSSTSLGDQAHVQDPAPTDNAPADLNRPVNPASASSNSFRFYFAKIHREQDFKLIIDGIHRILGNPIQTIGSLLPGSQKQLQCYQETMSLLWDLIIVNPRFKDWLLDTEKALDVLILLLYYSVDHKSNPGSQGLHRMCAYILQTLSADKRFAVMINKPFESHGSLPASVRIPTFSGSYADFMIIQLYNLIATTKGTLSVLYPSYTLMIVNVSPHLEKVSMVAANKLMSLFSSFSAPAFLLAEANNHKLAHYMLEALNYLIQYQFAGNYHLIYAMVRAQRKFEKLSQFTLATGVLEIQRMQEGRNARTPPVRATSTDAGPRQSLSRRSSAVVLDMSSADGEGASIAEREARDLERARARSLQEESAGTDAVEDDGPAPISPQELSEKARGKLPEGVAMSRQASHESVATVQLQSAQAYRGKNGFTPTEDWVSSWQMHLPLEPILVLLNELVPQVHSLRPATEVSVLKYLRGAQVAAILPQPPITIKTRSFTWTEAMIVWKTSLLWGRIYVMSSQPSTGGVASGVFHMTNIKLFHLAKGGRGFVGGGPAAGLVPKQARDAVSGVVNQFSRDAVGFVSNFGRQNSSSGGATSGLGSTERAGTDRRGSALV